MAHVFRGATVYKRLGITKKSAAPHRHNESGMAERIIQSVIKFLTCTLAGKEHHSTWDERLPWIMWTIRTSVNQSTGYTPFYLETGREARQIEDRALDTNGIATVYGPWVTTLKERLQTAQVIREAIEGEEFARRRAGPSQPRAPPVFEVGSYVYHRIERYTHHAEDGQKLVPQWQGPYVVRSKVADAQNRYNIARTETSATFEVHSDRLKASAPRTYGEVALALKAPDGVGAGRGMHLMDSTEMIEIDRIVAMNGVKSKALVRFVGKEQNDRWIKCEDLRGQYLGDLLAEYEEGHLRATRGPAGERRFSLPAAMAARWENKRTHDAYDRPLVIREKDHHDPCAICDGDSGKGNALLMCATCPRVFHFGCLNLDVRPRAQAGQFTCPHCRELEDVERPLPPSMKAARAPIIRKVPLTLADTEPPGTVASALKTDAATALAATKRAAMTKVDDARTTTARRTAETEAEITPPPKRGPGRPRKAAATAAV